MSRRIIWRAVVIAAALFWSAPAHAQVQLDTDADGVPDSADCAPTDPRLSIAHTYYWDLDGDRSGDSSNAYTLCWLQPFRGSAAIGGDPADHDDSVAAPFTQQGARVLGLDFTDGAVDGQWRPDLARELGASAASFQLQWNAIEAAPGIFSGPQATLLSTLASTYGSQGFSLTLGINPLIGATSTLPADIAHGVAAGTTRLSDPAVIARFRAVLDFVKVSVGMMPVTALNIGYDVDQFLAVRTDVQFWSDYVAFFQAARTHARALWGDSIPVGISATREGLLREPTASLMAALNGSTDVVTFSYVPAATPMVPDPSQVRGDIEQVIARYFPKPLVVASAAFPSSPAVGSSETRQAQFIGTLFATWDAYALLMPAVSLGRLFDPATGGALRQSSGLRTRQDEAKSGYRALRTATVNRGFWESPLVSRPFLLGFTTAMYDHVPGGPRDPIVLSNIGQQAGLNGDLISYHFDNGVPWVEALADPFTSATPPYSANVLDVWSKERAVRPPGSKVAVAINPIGVPRNVLAPYWGLGEGFYHDQDFNIIDNGIVQDYESRLLPAPWDGYRIDSPQVKTAFFNYVRRAIDYFDADYIVTGIEANLAIESDPDAFAQFVELQRYVHTQLRANPAYDHVKIVVSFVAEHLVQDEYGMPILIEALTDDELLPRHLQALSEVAPYTDLIGLSVYPIKSKFASYQILGSYFDSLYASVRTVTDKPTAITEAGYPSANFTVLDQHFLSDETEQRQFIRLLLHESAKHGVEFITNYSVRDQTPYLDKLRTRSLETPPFISPGLTEFYKYFEFIGLFTASGQPKAAIAEFAGALRAPLSSGDILTSPATLSTATGPLQVVVAANASRHLTYSVSRNGANIIEPSPLGVVVDGVDLGSGVIDIEVVGSSTRHEDYAVHGAHALARDHGLETTVLVRRTGAGDRELLVTWRLYDDGIAFRYTVPGQGVRTIAGESTGWVVPDGSPVWHQLSTNNYESLYLNLPIGYFDTDIGGPITIKLANGAGYLALTEGALRDYSGMTFDADLGSRLIKAEFLDDTMWQVNGGSPTPWRLAIIAPTLDGIVNSDLSTHVSPPPDPALFPLGIKTPWIRPGKAVWSWWSDQQSGASWDTQKQFIDYATRLRAEYVTVDAFWEEGFPNGGKDQFARLADLVTYGRTAPHDVGLFVWKSWFSLIDPVARRQFFQRVRDAGAVGVKVDNLDDTRTESIANVRVYEGILRDAATYSLMVIFHGIQKPTGLARTYPNLVAQEGVAGLEYTALLWSTVGSLPAAHIATAPFVRYAVGPADFTPVTFDTRKLAGTTLGFQLATAGILNSPVMHYADHPSVLLSQPLVEDELRTLPTVWDETIVLPPSEIGGLVAMARRAGRRWYVFAMNGNVTNGVSAFVPLSFLDGGASYDQILLGDETSTTFRRTHATALTESDSLAISLLAGGGLTAIFTPRPDVTRTVGQGLSTVPAAPTWAAFVSMYGQIHGHADVVSHSLFEGVPWPEALAASNAAAYPSHLRERLELFRIVDDAVVPSHKQYLLLSPIDTRNFAALAPLVGSGDYLPLPAPWNTYAFNAPQVKTAMLNYLIAAIDALTPAYLAIGARANILLAQNPAQWGAFKELNAFLYASLKQRYPSLKVFTTIDYEHLLGLADTSRSLQNLVRNFYPHVLENEVIDLLRASDYVAISSYPSSIPHNRYLDSTGRLDADYYDRAVALARQLGKPLAFDHIAYSSRDVALSGGVTLRGTEQLQADYLGLVLGVAHTEPAEFVVNALATDYANAYGDADGVLSGAYTGLFRTDGSSKPALAVWDTFRVTAEGGGLTASVATHAPAPTPFEQLADALSRSLTGTVIELWTAVAPPSPEAFVRWLEFAMFLPSFAGGSIAHPTSPWDFGDPFDAAARTVLQRRELFLPYLQPLFEAFAGGGPFPLRMLSSVTSPLVLVGDWILVAPVMTEGAATRDVTLPEGASWIDWYSGNRFVGGQAITVDAPLGRMPIFVRDPGGPQ